MVIKCLVIRKPLYYDSFSTDESKLFWGRGTSFWFTQKSLMGYWWPWFIFNVYVLILYFPRITSCLFCWRQVFQFEEGEHCIFIVKNEVVIVLLGGKNTFSASFPFIYGFLLFISIDLPTPYSCLMCPCGRNNLFEHIHVSAAENTKC